MEGGEEHEGENVAAVESAADDGEMRTLRIVEDGDVSADGMLGDGVAGPLGIGGAHGLEGVAFAGEFLAGDFVGVEHGDAVGAAFSAADSAEFAFEHGGLARDVGSGAGLEPDAAAEFDVDESENAAPAQREDEQDEAFDK